MVNEFKKYVESFPKEKRNDALYNCVSNLAKKVELSDVLSKYGVSVHKDFELQISCVLPSHEGKDFHNSARYYNDSDFGYSMYHCFKCKKTLNSFWLFYNMEKLEGISLEKIVYDFIECFKIDFEETFFDVKSEKKELVNLKDKISYFKNLKKSNINLFIDEVSISFK